MNKDIKYTIHQLLKESSFRKWARGEATAEEKEYWDNWAISNEKNREIVREALQEITGFSFNPTSAPDPKKALYQLNKKLNNKYNPEERHNRLPRTGRARDLKWVFRVAAGILIILTAGLLSSDYFITQSGGKEKITQEVVTDFGEQKNIKLSDGSYITLNANSTLMYTTDTEHPTNINIHLEGEAYFSVAKRKTQKEFSFNVLVEDGTIRVLGTEFNVSTRDGRARVVLEEGSVEITPRKDIKKENNQVILEPDYMAEFGKSIDTVIVRQVNTQVYTSWRKDELVLDRTPLSEILKRIEHTYGVNTTITDSELYGRTLSGTIENSEMGVALSTLSKVLSAPIDIRNDTVFVGKGRSDFGRQN